jgi:hypothetical protein
VNRQSVACSLTAFGIILCANFFLVASAAADHSFGSVQILLITGPITNLILGLIGVAFIPVVRQMTRGASVTPYLLTVLLTPFMAVFVDAGCILSMNIRGC